MNEDILQLLDKNEEYKLTPEQVQRYAMMIHSAPLMACCMAFRVGQVPTFGEAMTAGAVICAKSNQELIAEVVRLRALLPMPEARS